MRNREVKWFAHIPWLAGRRTWNQTLVLWQLMTRPCVSFCIPTALPLGNLLLNGSQWPMRWPSQCWHHALHWIRLELSHEFFLFLQPCYRLSPLTPPRVLYRTWPRDKPVDGTSRRDGFWLLALPRDNNCIFLSGSSRGFNEILTKVSHDCTYTFNKCGYASQPESSSLSDSLSSPSSDPIAAKFYPSLPCSPLKRFCPSSLDFHLHDHDGLLTGLCPSIVGFPHTVCFPFCNSHHNCEYNICIHQQN